MRTNLTKFIIPPTGSKHEIVSRFATSSPWKNEDVGFNAQNLPYPTLHSHEYYEILVILSGEITHTINGRDHFMREGDCCLIRPEDRHRMSYPSDSSSHNNFLSVNFMLKKDFYNKAVSCFDHDPIPPISQDDTAIAFHISNTIREKIRSTCLHIQTPVNNPTLGNVLICKAMIAELLHIAILSYATKNHIQSPVWLQELMIKMQKTENISKKTDELIADTPYSRSYVEKMFRRHFGTSVLEFRNSIKVAHAKELLSSTSLSISQIAEILGFESIPYFSMLFKKNYGVSPMQHRKQHHISGSVNKDIKQQSPYRSDDKIVNTSTVIFCSDVHLCQVDHYDYSARSRIENLIEKLNAFYDKTPYEELIFLGDYSLDHWGWCDGGSWSYGVCNTKNFIDQYAVKLKAPYHMAPGNHELYSNEKWKELTGTERDFCLTVGGYLIICCDNFAGELDPTDPSDGIYSPTNLQFVKQKLLEYPELPVILCSHYFDLQKEPESFYAFIKDEKRITLLVCGHDHLMDITDLGEAAGHVCLCHDGHYSYAGGNNSLSDIMWGFCQAKLTPTGIDIRYIEPENRIHTERFSIDHAYREQCCRFFPRRDINA